MTRADAIKYLIAQSTGVADASLNDVAHSALEMAYSEVWGSYRWTVRHTQTTLTTTASGATTNLPADFERAIWMGLQYTGNKHRIAIKEEEWFDLHYPYPADDAEGKPIVCKLVFSPGAAASDWKVYWWRVPDAAYTIALAYDRAANIGEFEKLPSHMLKAVMAGALAMVKGNIAERQNFDVLYERALARAQMADKPVSGVFPLFGPVPGYDDFDTTTSSVGDTDDPLDFYG